MAPVAGLRLGHREPGRHRRAAFTSGVDALDRYLTTPASQSMRRKANAVFVLVALDPSNADHSSAGMAPIRAS